MTMIKIIGMILGVVSFLWMFVRLGKRTNPIKTFVGSAFLVVLSLVLVCVAGQFFSKTLQINWYTVSTSAVLGIPGVILMVLIHLIWAF